jgi:hypothetical protein
VVPHYDVSLSFFFFGFSFNLYSGLGLLGCIIITLMMCQDSVLPVLSAQLAAVMLFRAQSVPGQLLFVMAK